MAPEPENNTARLFLDYTSRFVQHTLMLRLPDTASDPGAYATAYANILKQRMFDDDSFYGARFSANGSHFSLPLAFTAVPGVIPAASTSAWLQDPESVFLSFIDRGNITGRKGRVEFFTAVPTTVWPGDNRYNPGDAAPIDTLRSNFAAAAKEGGTFPLVSIGRDLVTVYNYVNIASNAYWQRKQRV